MMQGYEDPAGRFRIVAEGLFAVLMTDFGLNVKYDGNWYISVSLPDEVRNTVDGLCRNFNGDRSDDYTVGGVDYSSNSSRASIMGSIFQVSDPEDPQ